MLRVRIAMIVGGEVLFLFAEREDVYELAGNAFV
jgi:hypothetical protein